MDVLGKCRLCGKDFVSNKFGWGCSAWKDGCKAAIHNQIAGRAISEGEAKALLENGSIGPLNGFKSKKTGKDFSAKLVMDDEGKVKFVFEDKSVPTSIKCPKCGKTLKKDDMAYKCECGFKVYKKMAQRELTDAEVNELCTNGHTDKLDGFMSKKGNNFSAYVVLNGDSTEFSFDEPEDTTPTPEYGSSDSGYEDNGYEEDTYVNTDDFSDDEEEYPF